MNYELCNVTQKSRKFTEILIYAVEIKESIGAPMFL